MYKNKTFIGIIPARIGSKRLPKKNILNLAGKPLIFWTIEAGLTSEYLDEIIVSTDSAEIKEIGEKYGANVPFLRPKELATDIASSFDVVIHAIEFYQNEFKKTFDYIVLLQPTSPLRNSNHIDDAIRLLDSKHADAIISVCEMRHTPLWANTLPEDLSMVNFLRKDIKNKRSQDLPEYYRLNGAIYIAKRERLLEEETFFLKKNIFAFIMPEKNSIDIDKEFDFKLAEFIIKNYLME